MGLDQDMYVCECTSTSPPPREDANGVINIRWVPDGVSTYLSNDMNNPEYVASPPSLKLEYKGGDMDGYIEEFTPDRTYKLGRADDNDIVFGLPAVSRKHA